MGNAWLSEQNRFEAQLEEWGRAVVDVIAGNHFGSVGLAKPTWSNSSLSFLPGAITGALLFNNAILISTFM